MDLGGVLELTSFDVFIRCVCVLVCAVCIRMRIIAHKLVCIAALIVLNVYILTHKTTHVLRRDTHVNICAYCDMIHVCMYAYICVYIYIYTCVQTQEKSHDSSPCTFIYMYVCAYVHVHIHVSMYIQTYMHTHTQATAYVVLDHIYIYIYIYI